jgi:serine/threonine protein kinase
MGRFELRRELGRGAHGAVWLAWDPQMEREVALKTLAARGDGGEAGRLLREARAVGRLRHPNIVPVFEAGEHEGQAWLVFEYVEGRTLAQLLREEGPLPGARAAALLSGVLDALDEAHRQGIVHRDLKPSNILVDAQGQPRVADFGIAGPVSREGGGEQAPLCGTAAYMAPEYIARREVTPQGDVFAAGLCLYELATGRRAIEGEGLFQILHRIANQDLAWPEEAAARVDERLRGVIAKACARDPVQRYASAAEMRQALDDYLMPLPPAEGEGQGGGTLQFLLRRMRHKSDFPAMSSSISAITRMASSDGGDVNTLSNSILKDFALTNKILRIANSAYYRQFSNGGIATVSRAIVVLGFNTVRNIAMSLLFLDHLQNKPHAAQLREEFLRASLGGMLARRLAREAASVEPEEALICAQFHRLGRLLAHYYFPEEVEAIARLVAAEGGEEETAAARVLGIGYQDLGLSIARNWGFPEAITRSMLRVAPGKVAAARSREERLRALSGYANELCEAVGTAPSDSAAQIARLRLRYGDCLQLEDGAAAAALRSSVEDLAELSRIVRVDLSQTRIGRCLLPRYGGAPPAAPETADPLAATGMERALPPPGEAGAVSAAAAPEAAAEAVLAHGIQDISDALLEERPLGALLGIALEVMYRAMHFQRVLLCMREPRGGSMCARFGFGVDAESKVPRFRFALADKQCIFNIALSRDVDVLISDAADPKIAPYVPEWHRRDLGAQTFLLFPLRVREAPVALIYADREVAGSIVVNHKELGLLRTLRNQVLLAIKQAG